MDRARTWAFEFDPQSPAATAAVTGGGLRMVRSGDGDVEIWADHPNAATLLADLGLDQARILGSGGGIIPCYLRQRPGRIQLSNVASKLLDRGERVRVKTLAVVQHLLGIPYPQDNLFANLSSLEASGVYRISGSDLKYESTKLLPLSGATYEGAMEIIHRQWQRLTRAGQPLCVLLSGGYDSRLNLALAMHYAARNGNQVLAFHEYKNEAEAAIAKRVAESARIPLEIKTRRDFVEAERPVEMNRGFILLNSGAYRENLLRWHHYFSYIKAQHPHGALIGFGAEAHKGKFYEQVRHFSTDCETVFGVDKELLHQTAHSLGIRNYDRGSQNSLFRDLVEHAQVYDDASSRIDFVHYQTYVANGYGKRCHSVWQLFDFTFPFLDEEFLRIVFSMPRAEKEGFRIVRRAIEELQPRLAVLPYTSGNEKALKVTNRNLARQLSHRLRSLLRPMYDSLRKTRAKGRGRLHIAEQALLDEIKPASEVTHCLHELVQTNLAAAPRIRLDYALQLLLYFHLLEQELALTFEWS